MSREVTNKLWEKCEEGLLSWEEVAQCCLKYMSEDDVADMAHVNELLDEDEEEEYDIEESD